MRHGQSQVKAGGEKPGGSGRLPPWLKRRLPAAGRGEEVSRLLSDLRLETVCTQAH